MKITTIEAPRSITDIEFCAWIAQALPGDRLEYHRGFLVVDRHNAGVASAEVGQLRRLAGRALWAANSGLVHLVQRRLGEGRFAYVAIARPKPSTGRIALNESNVEQELA